MLDVYPLVGHQSKDDKEEINPDLVAKYRLNPERNKGYRDFYTMMYGLPMSLSDQAVKQFGEVES